MTEPSPPSNFIPAMPHTYYASYLLCPVNYIQMALLWRGGFILNLHHERCQPLAGRSRLG
ncbi:hypothetical protein XSR1_10137 [Xenorhabdus szentirmaii DSM 16338]|uniref:Uncharacterized protein n=1 Tax=Xenorhabdus szentirmaii DSM 16338 TaxID=1427518 RepID=W1IQ93_9GAMM|nr:hypothetical protein XSR1_10137 [Xenorhabdus szentirmaii DSM 16338]